MEGFTVAIQDDKSSGPVHAAPKQGFTLLYKIVVHGVVVLLNAYVLYTVQPGSTLFSWHPTLMILAYVFLMLEGIIFFSSQSSLFPKLDRKIKVRLHWIFMLAAAACSSLGMLAIYINKNNKNSAHYTTWHGQIGLGTVIYTLAQCCAGPLQLYPHLLPKSLKLGQLKAYHATSGLVLFSLVSLSLFLGMWSKYFTRLVTGTSWYACLACPMIMALVVMEQVSGHYLTKTKKSGTKTRQK